MCGIAGIVDFAGAPIDPTIVETMCDAIRHRGPDDRGVVILGPPVSPASAVVGLGNQRLSIIDVSGGRQPIANEDQTIWTVFNGELYNFQAVRHDLQSRGHRFRTSSDTEVLVHLYEEKGDRLVDDLDGMFAFALWDGRQERLLLARDRFGKKPLLYADDGERLVFGSEFGALLASGEIRRDLDEDGIDAYLALGVIPAPLTVFRSIRKLPPASLLVRDRRGARIRRYWALRYVPKHDVSWDEAAVRTRELLSAAVRKRMVAEVPLGAFLSGGIDSSAVVGIMSGLGVQPVKTFSIGFEDHEFNELPHARRIAHRFHCDHHEFVVKPKAVELLPILVRHFGEPYADSSAVPSYCLARLAREHVTVALNGDGGDEAFAGYQRHFANRLVESWRRTPALFRRVVDRVLALSAGEIGTSPLSRARRFVRAASRDRSARYAGWIAAFDRERRVRLACGARQVRQISRVDRELARLFGLCRDLDSVDAFLAADTETFLPDDLLVKMDIVTMANSLEARSPFLDHHLVEFVARLPSSFKLRGRSSKHVLKRAVGDLLPAETLTRSKRGFVIPLDCWFRHELRDFVADYLIDRTARERGIFEPRVVQQLLGDHQAGRANNGSELWVLLMFELWHRQFIDERRYRSGPAFAPVLN